MKDKQLCFTCINYGCQMSIQVKHKQKRPKQRSGAEFGRYFIYRRSGERFRW